MGKIVKRLAVVLMALAMVLTAAVPGTAATAEAAVRMNVKIVVNGKTVNGNGYFKTTKSGKKIAMIPMRKVCKAAGITVTKNKDGSYRLDTGEMHVDFCLNKNSYSFTTSIKGADGATGPVSCGAAAVVKGSRIYIPADVLTPLYGNVSGTVKVSSKKVTITTAKSTGSGVVNPVAEYTTLTDLNKALGFTMVVPTAFASLKVKSYASILASSLGEIFYTSANGKDEILYRMSKGTEDNSGDYTQYKTTATATVNGHTVTLKGTDTLFNLAVWNDGTYSYSINVGSTGVSQADLTADVASVK